MPRRSIRKLKPQYDHLSIDDIISGPLTATAVANSMMAKEQIQFLMDFCFAKDGDVYKPVMIQMSIDRAELETTNDDTKQLSLRKMNHGKISFWTVYSPYEKELGYPESQRGSSHFDYTRWGRCYRHRTRSNDRVTNN